MGYENDRYTLHTEKALLTDFAMNQCSIMVRVGGQQLEIPVMFGLSEDDIRRMYPYLLQYADVSIKNPMLTWDEKSAAGEYTNLTDEEYQAARDRAVEQSKYWCGRSSASILEIGMRFALDIQFRTLSGLEDLFCPVTSVERVEALDIESVTNEEANTIEESFGLVTEADRLRNSVFVPKDEQDVDFGSGGGLVINQYGSSPHDDYMSDQLDELEANEEVSDPYFEMINGEVQDAEEESEHADDDSGMESDASVYADAAGEPLLSEEEYIGRFMPDHVGMNRKKDRDGTEHSIVNMYGNAEEEDDPFAELDAEDGVTEGSKNSDTSSVDGADDGVIE